MTLVPRGKYTKSFIMQTFAHFTVSLPLHNETGHLKAQRSTQRGWALLFINNKV